MTDHPEDANNNYEYLAALEVDCSTAVCSSNMVMELKCVSPSIKGTFSRPSVDPQFDIVDPISFYNSDDTTKKVDLTYEQCCTVFGAPFMEQIWDDAVREAAEKGGF